MRNSNSLRIFNRKTDAAGDKRRRSLKNEDVREIEKRTGPKNFSYYTADHIFRSGLNNNEKVLPFVLNFEDDDEMRGYIEGGFFDIGGTFDSEGNREEKFWVGYILGAYQSTPASFPKGGNDPRADNDPHPEAALGGVAFDSSFAKVFLEELRDEKQEFRSITGPYTARVVAHEIGHEFGLDDEGTGLMGNTGQSKPQFDISDVEFIRRFNESPGHRPDENN